MEFGHEGIRVVVQIQLNSKRLGLTNPHKENEMVVLTSGLFIRRTHRYSFPSVPVNIWSLWDTGGFRFDTALMQIKSYLSRRRRCFCRSDLFSFRKNVLMLCATTSVLYVICTEVIQKLLVISPSHVNVSFMLGSIALETAVNGLMVSYLVTRSVMEWESHAPR